MPRPKTGRRRLRRWVTTLVVGGAIVGVASLFWPTIASVKSPHAMVNRVPMKQPGAHPLGHPPRVRHGIGSFSFVAEQQMSDAPVAYDPCRRITYAIREELAPPGSDKIVEEALREVSRVTGLVFVRRAHPPREWTYDWVDTSYGRSPVIIDWTNPQAVPGLRGEEAGLGRSLYMTDGPTAERFYVTGAVALDTPQLETLLAGPNGAARVRAVVMHQLGHVVGLDDVDDKDELMHGPGSTRLTFGPGDREGLAALGSGPCF